MDAAITALDLRRFVLLVNPDDEAAPNPAPFPIPAALAKRPGQGGLPMPPWQLQNWNSEASIRTLSQSHL